MQGIGGAMFEAIRFENGRILNPHFAEYRVPRFTDAPQIEVEFVERKDLPTAGAGETPLIGLAANRREKRADGCFHVEHFFVLPPAPTVATC